MRYRRLLEQWHQQNWTAVVIDLVIVVLGVFIGIQMANWNTDRTNHVREAGVLREIAADLRQDREEFAAGRKVALGRIAAATYTLARATGRTVTSQAMPAVMTTSLELRKDMAVPETAPPGEEVRHALWASIIAGYYPTPSTTAFDSLVSAGDLGLIRDDALVREIQAYRLVLAGLDSTQNNTLRPLANAARAVGQAHGLADFGHVDEKSFLALVAERPPLAATIESQLGWVVMHIAQIDTTDQRAAELLKRVEKETPR